MLIYSVTSLFRSSLLSEKLRERRTRENTVSLYINHTTKARDFKICSSMKASYCSLLVVVGEKEKETQRNAELCCVARVISGPSNEFTGWRRKFEQMRAYFTSVFVLFRFLKTTLLLLLLQPVGNLISKFL